MIQTVEKVIAYYMKNLKKPTLIELGIEDKTLLEHTGSLFVTLYSKGEVRGASGNIKELKNSLAEELIENTIGALTKDPRFKPVTIKEAKDIKIRIDIITNRSLLKNKTMAELEPVNSGIIVIKNDYSKMAAILPNINAKIVTGEDYIPILKKKLGEPNFKEADYIIYEIETEKKTNY